MKGYLLWTIGLLEGQVACEGDEEIVEAPGDDGDVINTQQH